jgi:hypothetical protein
MSNTQEVLALLRREHDKSLRELQNFINAEQIFQNSGGTFKSLLSSFKRDTGFKIEVIFTRSTMNLDFPDIDEVINFQTLLVQQFINLILYPIFNVSTMFIPLPTNSHEEIFLPSEESYDVFAHVFYEKIFHPSNWPQQIGIHDDENNRYLYFTYPTKASMRRTRLNTEIAWQDFEPFTRRPFKRVWFKPHRVNGELQSTIDYPNNIIMAPMYGLLLVDAIHMHFEDMFQQNYIENVLNAGSDIAGQTLIDDYEHTLLDLIRIEHPLSLRQIWKCNLNNIGRAVEWINQELVDNQIMLMKHAINLVIEYLWGEDKEIVLNLEYLGGGLKKPTAVKPTTSTPIEDEDIPSSEIPSSFSNNFLFKHLILHHPSSK